MYKSILKRCVVPGIVAFLAVMTIWLAGCKTTSFSSYESTKSYTFSVTTGEKVEVLLDTSTGFDLRQEDNQFYVTKDGEDLVLGVFAGSDGVEKYKNIIEIGMPDTTLEQVSDNTSEWSYNGKCGRIIELSDSTYVVLSSLSSADEDLAKSAFDALSVSLV